MSLDVFKWLQSTPVSFLFLLGSAESYQRLLDLVEQTEAVEGIQHGLDNVKRGRTRPMRAAVEELGQQYEKVSS